MGIQSGGRPAAERTNGVKTVKRHLDLFFHEIAPYRYLSLKQGGMVFLKIFKLSLPVYTVTTPVPGS
jgi:hypothetical protein